MKAGDSEITLSWRLYSSLKICAIIRWWSTQYLEAPIGVRRSNRSIEALGMSTHPEYWENGIQRFNPGLKTNTHRKSSLYVLQKYGLPAVAVLTCPAISKEFRVHLCRFCGSYQIYSLQVTKKNQNLKSCFISLTLTNLHSHSAAIILSSWKTLSIPF